MPTIDVGEAELFFTDSGGGSRPSGPPILLVHGWTCDSHDWVFQLDPFQAEHRVIAVDLRGHGRSSAPASGYSMQCHAGDLATLLKRREVDPVVVVGHSLGGSVAAALAVEHPSLVRAMVAVEPAYGQDKANVDWMREATEPFGSEGGNEVAAALMGATEPLAPQWMKTWHARRTLGMPPELLRTSFGDLYFSETQFSGQPQSDEYLARRTCPTLAFHRLPDMAAWEQQIMVHPSSRVVSWEGAGHWLHQERPVEFNALVLDWIDGLPAADARLPEGATA